MSLAHTASRRKWLLVLPMAALLASCSKTIDSSKLEATIKSGIEKQTDATVKSVVCPDDRPAKAGDVFYCTVTDDQGNTAKVKVTQKDDQGNVSWELNG